MNFFRKYFDDLIGNLTSIGSESGQINDLELIIFTGYVNSLDDEYIITQFIEKCFPHLHLLKAKDTPKPLLDLIRAKNFSNVYDSLAEEEKEELWELIHGLVKSSILYIHQIKEYDGEKYTKRYFCEHKIGKLSEEWNVKLV